MAEWMNRSAIGKFIQEFYLFQWESERESILLNYFHERDLYCGFYVYYLHMFWGYMFIFMPVRK